MKSWERMSGKFMDNKKRFQKEVNSINKRKQIQQFIKNRDGELMRAKDVEKQYTEYYEDLLNFRNDRKAELSGLPMLVKRS